MAMRNSPVRWLHNTHERKKTPMIRMNMLFHHLAATLALGGLWGCGASTPEPEALEPSQSPAGQCQPTVGSELPDADSFAEGQQQIAVGGAAAPYRPCPPSIPFECEMAILEGDPREPVLFTIRFRTNTPWVMPPHSHPRAERVTVISGDVHVGFGPSVDKTRGTQFTTGDYYVNAPSAVHYVWADDPMELQITGIGPWEVDPHE
jgi:hypothetical protein